MCVVVDVPLKSTAVRRFDLEDARVVVLRPTSSHERPGETTTIFGRVARVCTRPRWCSCTSRAIRTPRLNAFLFAQKMDTATSATHPEAIPATADVPSRLFLSSSTSCKDTTEMPVTLVKPELVSATTSEPSSTLRESCSAKPIDDDKDGEDCVASVKIRKSTRTAALATASNSARRRRSEFDAEDVVIDRVDILGVRTAPPTNSAAEYPRTSMEASTRA